MFTNEQLALFNRAYGAWRDALTFLRANLHTLEGDRPSPAEAAVLCDIDLQKMLFRVSSFPGQPLEEAEQTFIRSMLEHADELKSRVPGYGRFYRTMSPERYPSVAGLFDARPDHPLVLEAAVCAEQRSGRRCVQTVMDALSSVLGAYAALCPALSSGREAAALRLLASFSELPGSVGIGVRQAEKLEGFVSGESPAERELASLIGLDAVKREVSELVDLLKLNEMRARSGIAPIRVSRHMIFTGNPGTGKTTVARLLARIYNEFGVLSKGHLVEADRSKLVAAYLGQTAIKVQKVIESALGGVLFIDEAYMLSQEHGDSYGQEAIDTLLKEMEDHRDDLIVIAAGYPDLMETFINSNPGLRSRFNRVIRFPDYTPEELQRIFEQMMRKDGFTLTDGAKEKLMRIWEAAQKNDGFGNGRGVRNIYEKVIVRQASRMVSAGGGDPEALLRITEADIPDYAPPKKETVIGFR